MNILFLSDFVVYMSSYCLLACLLLACLW